MRISRLPGRGWIVLIGGGEFSFGETEEIDRAWLARVPPGPIAFVPAASGSNDYGRHFAAYLDEVFERPSEIVPIYRPRDARRGKNSERLAMAAAVYLGGGVAERLLEAFGDSPAGEALIATLADDRTVVAIAAAAQALGSTVRTLRGDAIAGLGWLPAGVVEPNFDPTHDRRLRRLLELPDVEWGLGLTAGSSVALGPEGAVEVIGQVFGLDSPDGDWILISETATP